MQSDVSKNPKTSLIDFVVRSNKRDIKKNYKILTTLSAACPIRHSLNGGDSLNSTTIHWQSDCGFGHYGLIYLYYIYIKKDI